MKTVYHSNRYHSLVMYSNQKVIFSILHFILSRWSAYSRTPSVHAFFLRWKSKFHNSGRITISYGKWGDRIVQVMVTVTAPWAGNVKFYVVFWRKPFKYDESDSTGQRSVPQNINIFILACLYFWWKEFLNGVVSPIVSVAPDPLILKLILQSPTVHSPYLQGYFYPYHRQLLGRSGWGGWWQPLNEYNTLLGVSPCLHPEYRMHVD